MVDGMCVRRLAHGGRVGNLLRLRLCLRLGMSLCLGLCLGLSLSLGLCLSLSLRCLGCLRLRLHPFLDVLPLLLLLVLFAHRLLLPLALQLGLPGSCFLLLLLLLLLQLALVLGMLPLFNLLSLSVLPLNVINDLEPLKPRFPSGGAGLAISIGAVGTSLSARHLGRQALVQSKHVSLLLGRQGLVGCHLGDCPLPRLGLRRLVRVIWMCELLELCDRLLRVLGRLQV